MQQAVVQRMLMPDLVCHCCAAGAAKALR
jgi:hypothetical protein